MMIERDEEEEEPKRRTRSPPPQTQTEEGAQKIPVLVGGEEDLENTNTANTTTTNEEEDEIKDELEIGRNEAGFLIGERGATKRKVQKVSQTKIEIADSEINPETSIVTIRGTDTNRAKARRYVAWVLRQPEGKIFCDLGDDVVRENVSVVDVPAEAMAFVVGAKGKTLRSVEEEYGTLMFFGHTEKDQPDSSEKLIICGDRENRRGAELKVMSSVETKVQGYFVDYEKNDPELKQPLMQPGDGLKDGFAYDQFPFTEEEFSYALGKFGRVRRKLAKASGCVMEYVGRVAIMSGNKEQRARCWDYTNWLMKQRRNNGTCSVDPNARNDCEICDVPGSIDLPRLQGNCHKVEEATGTFIFTTDFEKPVAEGQDKTLLICSHDSASRRKARRMVEDLIDGRRDVFQDNNRGGPRGRGGGGGNRGRGGQQQQQRGMRNDGGGAAEACRNFQMGRCTRGNQCKYSHDMSMAPMQMGGGSGANRGGRGYDDNHPRNNNNMNNNGGGRGGGSQIINRLSRGGNSGGGGNGNRGRPY